MGVVWMMVTRDKYELPVVVANTAKELAEVTGKSEENIRSSVCKAEKTGRRCKYVRVRIEERGSA